MRLHQAKGGHDRGVPLRKKLLETLRVYGRWMKPKPYLFPGLAHNRQADVPVTTKVPWAACPQAAKRAEIAKPISRHALRHRYAPHLLDAGANIAR